MKKIVIINGPCMNFLGEREVKKYSSLTLLEVEKKILKYSLKKSIGCDFFQSNSEGEIVSALLKCKKYDGVILNAAAYSHYSIAIFDAILAIDKPVIEVHMTNIFERETFRHKSVISSACIGVISGFGINSYLLAIENFSLKFD